MENKYSRENCPLCNAVIDSKMPSSIYNQTLFETENFLILSTIGPISLGHILIISKRHFENLSKMDLNIINEYERTYELICEKIPFYRNALQFEHGALETENQAACIVHTHVHLIPGLAKYEGKITENLLKLIESDNLSGLNSIKNPYLMVKGESKKYKFYEANNLPSQFVRRILAKELKLDDFDWIIRERLDLIAKTNNLWLRKI